MAEWRVPFVGFKRQYAEQRDAILQIVDSVIGNGDLILREQTDQFEANLAAFCGVKHAIGLSNGTDALHLMLRAADIGPGDEVITVAHTFVATAAAVAHMGATPVLVDIGDDRNLDVSKIEAAITPRTRGVIAVHLNGRVCDMDALDAVVKKHRLTLFEDAAQCLGATYRGRQGGSFGIAGTFSFYPAKLLGALGDGGALITNDDQIADRVRWLRNHGRTPDNDVAEWSWNARLDNFQAAILDMRLKLLPGWLERRREIARQYTAGLGDLKQVGLPPAPTTDGPYHDVYQNYEIEADNRDALRDHLTARGVETMVTWGGHAIHQFPRLGLGDSELPRTDALIRRALLLPMFPELTDDEVAITIAAVREFYQS